MSPTPPDALSFVQSVALPAAVHKPPQMFSGPLQFEDGKEQLFTVGPNAVAFESGVPGHLRSVITNSLLLAQLATQQQGVNAYDEDQTKWLKAYGQVLSNMGWQVTEVTDSQSVDNESDVDVHDAIISLVTAVIAAAGGGLLAAALPLIKTALESLDKMDASSPWITLYKDTSQSTRTASFQLMLAQPDQNAEVTVSALAFVFIATKEIKQILFFKRSMADATLKYRGSKATINPEALGDDVQGELEKRLATYITNYISAIALPDPAAPDSKET